MMHYTSFYQTLDHANHKQAASHESNTAIVHPKTFQVDVAAIDPSAEGIS